MRKQKERGFTLIELLITLFILSVVLLGLGSMVYSVMHATSISKETSTATILLQDKIEALKNTNVTSLTTGNDLGSPPPGNIQYLRQWIVTSAGNYRTITVTVNWTDHGPHTVSATTLRGN